MHREFELPLADGDSEPAEAAEELLRRYASGERYFQDAVLGGAELNGADLMSVNFEDADMEDTQLRDTDLSGAWLRSAN